VGATWCRQARRPSGDLLLGGGRAAFYMLYAYSKNEQGDLTLAQTRQLGQLVREKFR